MKIGMIGSGSVGQTLGAGLAALGHEVTIGIRAPSAAEMEKPRQNAETLAAWAARTGARVAGFAEAAGGADMVFNATRGDASLAALGAAGAANLTGKVLVDVANPLDFSKGMPPFLIPALSGPTSLGEEIQKAFPEARVVKAFNTIAAAVMVDPGKIPGEHDLFLAGNDAGAKDAVAEIARGFGWTRIVDLGDIVGARASEALLPFWVRQWMTGGTPLVNIRVARG
jgi:predicted dinucleotide-binding enzyme